jgi:hypothetical protein
LLLEVLFILFLHSLRVANEFLYSLESIQYPASPDIDAFRDQLVLIISGLCIVLLVLFIDDLSEFVIVCSDESLVQIALFLLEVLDDCLQIRVALLVVLLNVDESLLILRYHDLQLLLVLLLNYIGHYLVLDHLGILTKPKCAKCLL